MLVRKIATVLLVFGILAVTRAASAQSDVGQVKEKTFVNRLDELGKSIFGGILPAEKTKAKDLVAPQTDPQRSPRKPTVKERPADADVLQSNTKRAGSILTGSDTTRRAPTGGQSSGSVSEMMPENTPLVIPRTVEGTQKPNPQKTIIAQPRSVASDPPSARPLHERLSAVRVSIFASDSPESPRPQSNIEPDRPSEASTTKSTSSEPETTKPAGRPIIAQRDKPRLDIGETRATEIVRSPAIESPFVATEKPSPVAGKETRSIEKKPVVIDTTPVATEKAPVVTEKTPTAAVTAPATDKPESNNGLLMSRKGPILSVETLGPRRISVGKESTYAVGIVNSGEVAAEDLVVFVSLPEWADVAGADVTTGTAEVNALGQTAGTMQWKLGHLDAKARERLTLRIIPRQSRPFDLAVRWDYKPVASQAMIEVQEPKLALQLEGPREVLYGKKEAYRLRLTNVGNGSAENVALMLMPIGGGENVPAAHKIGLLAAGEEKVLDVELTARQAGNLTIQVDVRAEGNIHTELAEKVFVRRAGLKIDVEGPRMQYVGIPVSYAIRVRNPGTAPARNVNLTVTLPAGAKYVSGIEGARLDDSESKLQWTVETIGPEVEQSFVLKCTLGVAGMSRIQINAAADDDLTTTAAALTRVESVANLVMDVVDPEGPVAVGDEAIYEVRVRNRGTKEAVNIEVFAYFSRGIEPTGAEGSPNRVGPGQVSFQPIPSLAAGAEVVLKIRARAETAGNHIFRAEAHCKPLSARLIREATNLYYADAPTTQQAMRPPETTRTVARPIQGEQATARPQN